MPEKTIAVSSAWKGLKLIIKEILNQFNIERDSCIEFGVAFGFSTVVFSNYFNNVTRMDTFTGDERAKYKGGHYDNTRECLVEFENIDLKSDYREWIKKEIINNMILHILILSILTKNHMNVVFG